MMQAICGRQLVWRIATMQQNHHAQKQDTNVCCAPVCTSLHQNDHLGLVLYLHACCPDCSGLGGTGNCTNLYTLSCSACQIPQLCTQLMTTRAEPAAQLQAKRPAILG